MIKPIYDDAKKQRKRIIAVSDMYHDKKTIKQILLNSGYQMDEIYVSCEYNMTKGNGDLYKKVLELESIDREDIVHFGDNNNSDYNQALLMGITAIQTPKNVDYFLSNKNNRGFVSFLKRHDDLASSIHIALASRYLNGKKKDYYKLLGYVFGGPLSLGYMNFVCNHASKDNIDCLLFVSRDGYLLKEVYEKYFFNSYLIDYSYAYLSRAAIFSGTIENKLCTDLRKFLEIVKIDHPGINVFEDDENNNKEYERHKDTIDAFSTKRSNNLRKHLNKISNNKNRIAVVDMVSGKFTSFNGAKFYLCERIKKGYFAGSFTYRNENCEFYCDRLLDLRDNLAVNLSEFLISSYEEPIIGINDEANPIYEQSKNSDRKTRYNLIMEGIFEYCDDFLKLFNINNDYILSFDEWLDMASSYLGECSDEDLVILSKMINPENPVTRKTDKNFKQMIENYRVNGY